MKRMIMVCMALSAALLTVAAPMREADESTTPSAPAADPHARVRGMAGKSER